MYIQDGALRQRRSIGLWIIPALFWSILNLICLFFTELFNISLT